MRRSGIPLDRQQEEKQQRSNLQTIFSDFLELVRPKRKVPNGKDKSDTYVLIGGNSEHLAGTRVEQLEFVDIGSSQVEHLPCTHIRADLRNSCVIANNT